MYVHFNHILKPATWLTSLRIDVSLRIRRAIHLKDLTLLKRIIKNNPKYLQNPDFTDNGNTSLHLAAQMGLVDIAVRSLPSTHCQQKPILSYTPGIPNRCRPRRREYQPQRKLGHAPPHRSRDLSSSSHATSNPLPALYTMEKQARR